MKKALEKAYVLGVFREVKVPPEVQGHIVAVIRAGQFKEGNLQ